ncbi:MAG: alpha-galactosidase [Armatimonadota bacterium]
MKQQWVQEHIVGPGAKMPFSFVYDGQTSETLLPDWTKAIETRELDAARMQYTLAWTDPKTGLKVRCVSVEQQDYPVVEWTVYFKNTGTTNTPILENIQGLDARFERGTAGEFVLHGIKGDSCTLDSYQPYELTLAPMSSHRFAPDGGRPSNGAFPYYNLQMPDGGILLAIGWPGQWAASFTRDAANGLRIIAGQELTHLTLQPGEVIRTPLTAMLFWQGDDPVKAQNLWRRWMFAQNFPREHGEPVSPKLAGFCGNYFPGYRTNQEGELAFIDRYSEESITLDYWWMDAGWYPCEDNWVPVGTWEVDRTRYPEGLRAISDHAHSQGMQFILWFEPERVTKGSWLAIHHPEWVLGGNEGGLLDFGNTTAWHWLVECIDSTIVSEAVDIYRQDFNMDPLDYWRANDPADRQGITENKHVQGYLALWDELRRRHPGMLIDSCAAGGRRNDLETMRRAVPFLNSDYCTDPDGAQCHTYGFNCWLPYYRGATDKIDTYDFYSNISPLMMLALDMRDTGLDYASARKLIEQWRQVAPDFFGDFYPLTSYSMANNVWMAWQFVQPEQGDGVVQAFRRADCGEPAKTFRLNGLDFSAKYEVTNIDMAGSIVISGRDLMEKGLPVEITDKPGAAVITFRLLK